LSQTLLKPSVESYAAFGQLTYSLSPSLRVIAGARYSVDDKSFSGLNQSSAPGRPFLLGQPCYAKADPCVRDVFSGSKKFKSFTYKVGVEYDVGPQNMLFATYATGYKAGGFSGVSVIGTNNEALPYDPEKLKALEIGSRNRFFDGRVQLNLQGFYWKYTDAQSLFTTLNAAGNTVNAITNAGRATIYGADIELVVKPTLSDTLRVGGEFLHSNYDSFVYQTAGLIAGVTTGCTVTPVAPFQSVDCTGRSLARAPKYSATAGWTHAFDLGPAGSIETEISGQFVGSRYLTIDYIPATRAPSYVSGDATITYTNPGGWSLSAFVRNFTDAKIYTGGFTAPTLLRSVVLANIGAPRTFGGRVSWHF
jgi:iron complex outermembrane receptor protein